MYYFLRQFALTYIHTCTCVRRLRELISRIDEEHSVTLQSASQCDHYKEEIMKIQEQKIEYDIIHDKNRIELDALLLNLQSESNEKSNLQAQLMKLKNDFELYKDDNVDVLMKKEIMIINLTQDLESTTKNNESVTKEWGLSQEKRAILEKSIIELNEKNKLLDVELRDLNATLFEINGSSVPREISDEKIREVSDRVGELEGILDLRNQENNEFKSEVFNLNKALQSSLEESNRVQDEIKLKFSSDNQIQSEVFSTSINNLEKDNKDLLNELEKEKENLQISNDRILEIEHEMKDLVASLLSLEKSKEDENSEAQAHIEKLSDELQEIVLIKDILSDENSKLQNNFDIISLRNMELENNLTLNQENVEENCNNDKAANERNIQKTELLESNLLDAQNQIDLLSKQIEENNISLSDMVNMKENEKSSRNRIKELQYQISKLNINLSLLAKDEDNDKEEKEEREEKEKKDSLDREKEKKGLESQIHSLHTQLTESMEEIRTLREVQMSSSASALPSPSPSQLPRPNGKPSNPQLFPVAPIDPVGPAFPLGTDNTVKLINEIEELKLKNTVLTDDVAALSLSLELKVSELLQAHIQMSSVDHVEEQVTVDELNREHNEAKELLESQVSKLLGEPCFRFICVCVCVCVCVCLCVYVIYKYVPVFAFMCVCLCVCILYTSMCLCVCVCMYVYST